MRFFIALEIPAGSRKQLKIIQKKLKQLIPQVRLTDNEKLHLTLVFVGEQPDEYQQPLTQVVKKAVWGISPFEITPAYIDAFPNLHHPAIFWVGAKGDTDKLFIIRERIKDGLADLGLLVDERRFVPHIAVGKVRNFNLNRREEVALEKIPLSAPFYPVHITSIKLFQSIPQHGFHQHNTLAEIKLTGTKKGIF